MADLYKFFERKRIKYGAAVHRADLQADPAYLAAVLSECDVIVPENELKWHRLRGAGGAWQFKDADWLVAWARHHNKKVRGHTLAWGDSLGTWAGAHLNTLNAAQSEALLREHISIVMQRYSKLIYCWDVVNEPIMPWDMEAGFMRSVPWFVKIGPNWVRYAFEEARAADPHARLVLNQNYLEYEDNAFNNFREGTLTLLDSLLADDLVDAIGIQSHLRFDNTFNATAFASFLQELADRGLDILITELDTWDKVHPADIPTRDAQIAGMYEDYLAVCLEQSAVTEVITWGLSDKFTWIAEYGARDDDLPVRPLPLDSLMQPKPAYTAIKALLKEPTALLDGIVVYCPCDETSGMTVADVSGNGRNLTVTSPGGGIATTAAGKVGATSFTWTGTSGNASITNAAFLPGNAVTVMKWVKLSVTTGNQTFMGVGTNGLVGAEPWRLRKDSGQNRYQFQIRGGGTTVAGSRTAQGVIVPNTTDWVLLIGGYNQAESKVWLSENGGAKVVTNVLPSDYWPVRQDYTTFHLGSMNGTDWSRSLMNEAGVWNRELTAEEITELWNSGNGLAFADFSGFLGGYTVPRKAQWETVGEQFGQYLFEGYEDGTGPIIGASSKRVSGTMVGVAVSPCVGTGIDIVGDINPSDLLTAGQRAANYEYDAARSLFNLADITADNTWEAKAVTALAWYRDEYLAPIFTAGNWPTGPMSLPHGLYEDYIRNGTAASLTQLNNLAFNGLWTRSAASTTTPAGMQHSRDVAYSIQAILLRASIGGTVNDKLTSLTNHAINHLKRWFMERFPVTSFTHKPIETFRIPYTCEALIDVYEYTDDQALKDEIVFVISLAADHLYRYMWDATFGGFLYQDTSTGGPAWQTAPTRSFNLSMAPVYAWLFKFWRYPEYADQALEIFEAGVSEYSGGTLITGASLGAPSVAGLNGRNFNHSYRWSFQVPAILEVGYTQKPLPAGGHTLLGIASEPGTTNNPSVMRDVLGDYPNIVENYRFFPQHARQDWAMVDAEQGAASPDSVSPWPKRMMDHCKELGAIPCVTWEPWRIQWYPAPLSTTIKETIPLEEWTCPLHNYDRWLERWAEEIRNYGDPVIIRFGHEMNLKTPIDAGGYPWAEVRDPVYTAAHPGRYRDLVRYAVTRLRYHGAYNAFYNWCVLHTNVGPTSPRPSWNNMENYWPGRQYVDIGGADGYSGLRTPPRSFTQNWAECDARFANHIPEYATLETPFFVAETNVSDWDPTGLVLTAQDWLDWWLDAGKKTIEQNRWTAVFFSSGTKRRELYTRMLKHPAMNFVRNDRNENLLPPKQYMVTDYSSWSIDGTTIMRDEHPFFPCGWYYDSNYSGYVESQVAELIAKGTNFIYVSESSMTPAFIEQTERAGIAVMLETFDSATIAQYKDRPHVFGFYTYDDINNYTFAQVKARSDAAKAIAPKKLTYGSGVKNTPMMLGAEYSGAADVIAIQNYPIGNDPLADFQKTDASWLEFLPMIAPDANAAGQTWFCNPQGFSWKAPPDDVLYPTISEMRNMHWQPLLVGAKGLIYYASYSGIGLFHEHPHEIPGFMEEFAILAAETKTLTKYVCLGTRTVLTTNAARNAATAWRLNKVPGSKATSDKLLVIVLNWQPIGSGNNGTCTVTLPAGCSAKSTPFSRYGDGFTLSGNSISGTLNEEQVRIFLFDIA